MNLSIMQPYFFPYLGYYQLMHAADTFVLYDDVNFIKGGWINRNSILTGAGPQRITLDLKGASPNKLICGIEIGGNRPKLLKSVAQAYARAPFLAETMPLLDRCFALETSNLAEFLNYSLIQTAAHIGLETRFIVSSGLEKDTSLKGQDKVIDICRGLGARRYINAPGGRDLYDAGAFAAAGVDLRFLVPALKAYPQRTTGASFVPNLSVIDALMHTGAAGTLALLASYSLEA